MVLPSVSRTVLSSQLIRSDDPEHPPALEVTQAAVHRATGTSLGSICLGALIVASVRMVGRTAAEARRVSYCSGSSAHY